MVSAFGAKERKPGDICITDARGWPQINIVGKVGGEPQLVWLEKLQTADGEEINSNRIVGNIAEGRGSRVKGAQASLGFAQAEIDGRNVLDPTSPIRVVENKLHLPADRKVKSVAAAVDGAGNDLGIAFPSADVLSDITGPEQIRHAIEQEAIRMKKSVAFLLEPKNVSWVTENSRIMKLLIQRAASKFK